MLYKRSSFLKWLIDVHGCEVVPINRTNILIIYSKLSNYKMWVNPKDLIDYEEIRIACNRLHLQDLPGDKNLKKA
jgi:hypothetical protein